jgi:hypothetical protein
LNAVPLPGAAIGIWEQIAAGWRKSGTSLTRSRLILKNRARPCCKKKTPDLPHYLSDESSAENQGPQNNNQLLSQATTWRDRHAISVCTTILSTFPNRKHPAFPHAHYG